MPHCAPGGAALAATDAVISGEMENAFCAVRPPGHHATRKQAMGFCFFNNVAVAAKYALMRHQLKRVAIVDFDVHTAMAPKNLRRRPAHLMVGIFQHPFYPHSGDKDPAANMLNGRCRHTQRAWTSARLSRPTGSAPRRVQARMVFISAGFDALAKTTWASWAWSRPTTLDHPPHQGHCTAL
ncbi:hypothetical protein [Comamonas sp. JC664]|uniref:hypothetical protein n=1 Tax=Comamonas sp. JC664 TaxID=2801917 RepID=UPI00360C7754